MNVVLGDAVGWGTALQVGRSRVRIPMVSLEFFIEVDPEFEAVCNINGYQKYFLVCKGGFTAFTHQIIFKSGSHTLFEPSGSVRACRGIALHFYFMTFPFLILTAITFQWPPLWSSGQSFWLQIQRPRVRFPALPDFLSSSGSGTVSTQPREVNWGATWIKK